MKKIKIDGHELTIAELTLGQIKGLQSFIKDLEISPEIQVAEFLQSIIGRVDEFLIEVVFRGQEEAASVAWDDVPYSQLEDIFNAFFSQNPRLIKRLRDWLTTFVSQVEASHQTITSTNGPSTPSSGTSQEATSSGPGGSSA